MLPCGQSREQVSVTLTISMSKGNWFPTANCITPQSTYLKIMFTNTTVFSEGHGPVSNVTRHMTVTILQASVNYFIRNLTLYKYFSPVHIDEYFFIVWNNSPKHLKGIDCLLIFTTALRVVWNWMWPFIFSFLWWLMSRKVRKSQLDPTSLQFQVQYLLCFWRWTFSSNSKKIISIDFFKTAE